MNLTDVIKGPIVTEKLLAATSTDTVRSRAYTGKPARMLRSAWTDAWEDPAGPGPLGMPLQNILTSEANARIIRSGRTDLAFAPVGQIVGRMNEVRPVRDVMFQLVEEYIDGREIHCAILGDRALPLYEMQFKGGVDERGKPLPHIITYRAKWDPYSRDHHAVEGKCPVEDLEPEVVAHIEGVALAAALKADQENG